MKLNFIANQRGSQTKLRAVVDFFFPYTHRIRFEAATTFIRDKEGEKILREFGTFRAFAWHYYYVLFALPLKEILLGVTLAWGLVYTNSYVKIGDRLIPMRNFGGIAFDAATDSGDQANATPWTWTHTTTGSNMSMALSIQWWDNSGAITLNTPTYNSVNMTLGIEIKEQGYINHADVHYLGGAATGANSVSVSFTGGGSYGRAWSQTFSGTKTASPLDATASKQALAGGAGQSISQAIVTNNANSFIVDCASSVSSGTITAGGSQTALTASSRNGNASRRATTTAGSYTNSWSWATGGNPMALAILAINEATTAATTRFKTLLGAGQ